MREIAFNVLLASVELVVLLACCRHAARPVARVALAGGGLLLLGGALALVPYLLPGGFGGFYSLRLICWVVFAHAPGVLLLAAWRVRGEARGLARLATLAALALALVGADAFLVEPYRLRQVHFRFEHPEAPRDLRIALVADIQTDAVGEHERRALQMVAESRPDLVLFAGDYVSLGGAERRGVQQARLAALLAELLPPAALGAWAVHGDADGDDWERAFAGTGVDCSSQTRTVELLPGLWLSLLSRRDGHSVRAELPRVDGLHLALGHGPEFALSRGVDADLLLAGHTHGGQVRLPFFGPPMILSALPRDWARGLTSLGDGRALVVSAGIGMERGLAPRLRFLCPPEVVVIDVVRSAPPAS